jgi:hypothetical protein
MAIPSTFFPGMLRRYRGQVGPALPVGLGLALVAAWTVLSVGGIARWQEIAPFGGYYQRDLFQLQLIFSMIFGMLLAISPLTGSAFMMNLRKSRRFFVAQLPPLPPVLACLFCTLFIALIPVAFSRIAPDRVATNYASGRIMPTTIVLLAFCISVTYLARWGYLAAPKCGALMMWWIVLTWLVPVMVDLIVFAAQKAEARTFGTISSLSPPASLVFTWKDDLTAKTTLGLLVQCAVAIVPVVLYYGSAGARRPVAAFPVA